MLWIGAHLQGMGHDVSMLTGDAFRGLVEAGGLAFDPLDATESPPPAEPGRLTPNLIRRYLMGKADMRSTFVSPLVAQYRSLDRVLRESPVDVVLCDLAFTGALPLVTSGRSRPAVVVCGVGPLTLSSADTPPFGMAWIPRPGMDYWGMHAVVHRVMFRDIHKQLNDALSAVGAAGIDVSLMNWPRLADRLVQLTVPGFEYPRRDLPATVTYVGPVLPEPPADFEPPPWWEEALAAETVVHVTQGTLDNGDLDQLIGPTLRALADRDGVAVIVTTGHRDDRPPLADVPSNTHVAEWIPYRALLPHVDVMITNGGYGGTQHALRYGIPLVVGGESADKAEVAARVEYAGVGVNLGTANPTPEAIATAVRDAAGCREAAVRLGLQMGQTNPLKTIAEIIAGVDAAQRTGARG
jgi:UDP:flavonoid glycosyltransferase YjiC (YdhE family)